MKPANIFSRTIVWTVSRESNWANSAPGRNAIRANRAVMKPSLLNIDTDRIGRNTVHDHDQVCFADAAQFGNKLYLDLIDTEQVVLNARVKHPHRNTGDRGADVLDRAYVSNTRGEEADDGVFRNRECGAHGLFAVRQEQGHLRTI